MNSVNPRFPSAWYVRWGLCTIGIGLLLVARHPTARAQGGRTTTLEEEVIEDDDGDETVRLGEDENAPVGASENPDASPEFGVEDPHKQARSAEPVETSYPRELVRRPLTLHKGMFEMRLDLPSIVNPIQLQSQLSAFYGITDRVQIGLAYGPGTVSNHDVYDVYLTGKAIAVEARYQLTPWAAAQLTVPMYVDPFAMGLTLGVPMKFRFFGKAALVFGQDFFTIRTYRFAPSLSDNIYNQDRVGDLDTNTQISLGELRFVAGVLYQSSPKTAFFTEFGFVATDFSTLDPIVPLRVTISHSPSPRVDLGLRVGFNNLDRAIDEFGVMLSITLRI